MLRIGEHVKSLEKLVSPLSAFFMGTVFTCLAYGLLSSYLALRLNAQAISTGAVGLVLAVYYIGYIFASLSSYKIINRVGHIRAFSTYISILSALVLMHALSSNPWYWGVLRLLEGYCLGSAMMCLESWLNTRTSNANRGVIMSIYMITTYLGSALGQLFLNIPDPGGFVIFILVSVFYSVALVPISLTALPTPDIGAHQSMSLKRIYTISPVGVVGCIVSGVMVGSIYTLGAVYAQKIGLDMINTSLFMFFVIIGGMLAQLPVGKLSDKMDRRFVLMWESGLLFLIVPWIHYFINNSIWELGVMALLLGGAAFVMYPICVSHVNDKIDDCDRVEASGMLILLQAVGMIAGPIAISFAMQQWGPISYLLAFSILNGIYMLFCFKQIVFRPETDYISTSPTVPTPVAPTHVFTALSQDDPESLHCKMRNWFKSLKSGEN